MAALFPFYFLVFDGADPCGWSPFGRSIRELREDTRKRVPFSYRNDTHIEVVITCENPDLAADEAMSHVVGCFVDGAHLSKAGFEAFLPRFQELLNKLEVKAKFLSKHGFRLLVVTPDGSMDVDPASVKQIYQELNLREVPANAIQFDYGRFERRFHDVVESSAYAIANNPSLKPLFDGD